MRGFSAGALINTTKTVSNGHGSARSADWRPPCGVSPRSTNRFTNPCWFGQPWLVRTSGPVWIFLLFGLPCLYAQDQERKLMDRLLKPDMTLQNDAQNKKFIAHGSSPISKRATVGTFYLHQKSRSQSFFGTRHFSTTEFNSHAYHGGRGAYEVSSQQTMTNSRSAFASQSARGVRDAPQSGKKVASRA